MSSSLSVHKQEKLHGEGRASRGRFSRGFFKWWLWPTFSRSDDKEFFFRPRCHHFRRNLVQIGSKIAEIYGKLWNVTLIMTLIYDVKVIPVFSIFNSLLFFKKHGERMYKITWKSPEKGRDIRYFHFFSRNPFSTWKRKTKLCSNLVSRRTLL